jgi:AraC family transcriptional regulator, transcriptional activator of pobA
MENLFEIFQLQAEDVERIAAAPDEPHSHDYHELIIGVKGSLEHFIDFTTTRMQAPFVSFVTRGKTHLAKPMVSDGACDIRVIRFREDFLPDMTYSRYTQFHGSANFEMKPNGYFMRMVSLCEMIHFEHTQPSPNLSVERDLLKALLTIISSEHDKIAPEETASIDTRNTTFRNFIKILEENFARDVGVDFYAAKLFMSSRNLNLVCQQVISKSVSEIIEERKMAEGKKLLAQTDKSISEIGFEIGYNDKACFSTVFKRKNGQTPSEFRKHIRKMIS